MKRRDPDLSVVVVTHNGRDLALAALESAMAHTGACVTEWVIVDSGSSDGTPDAVEARWPAIDVIRGPNVGFAAANNVGFQAARGRYLLALNPDTEIREGRLADLVALMDARPSVGAISVIQEDVEGHPQPSIRRDPSVGRAISEALLLKDLPGCSAWQELEQDSAAYEQDRAADWLVGAFLLLRREALDAVGGFDERFFMYSEEADLCRRIRDAGWEVRHLPVMRVLHHGGAPSTRLVAQHAFSRIEYARKHFGGMQARAFRVVVAVHHLIRAVAASAMPRTSSRADGEWRALLVALGLAPPPFSGQEATGTRLARPVAHGQDAPA